MIYLFPVDGGGVSLIFTIYIPFFIIIGLICAFTYQRIEKKTISKWKKNSIFLIFLIPIILSTLYSFPCFDKNNLCPCEIVYNSAKVLANKNTIKFEDILIEKKPLNYPLIIVGQKKFKASFPEKIYYVNYENKETFDSYKFYAIYFRNGKIFSNNKNLKIEYLENEYIKFSENFENEKIEFISKNNRFIEIPNEYDSFYNNGYDYINLYKEFKNLNLNIRKEPERDIINKYGFYKFLYWIS